MEFPHVTRHGVAWKAKTEAIPVNEIAAPGMKHRTRNDTKRTFAGQQLISFEF